ncbi:hypothetical protein JCGZ_00162 [Jatropha curcas]|uniref:Uncharacterized protein n=1 Tax=Jatropha curcas TaxID=180498 RepID=A0A067L624_JATCU|nr:hypothetical protein JCGZ_00162 [Jatropha curcas]
MSNGSLRNSGLEEIADEQERLNDQTLMSPPQVTNPQVETVLTQAYAQFTTVLECLLAKPQQGNEHHVPS